MKMKVDIQKEIIFTYDMCGSHNDGFEICPGNRGSSYCEYYSAILKAADSYFFPYKRSKECLKAKEVTDRLSRIGATSYYVNVLTEGKWNGEIVLNEKALNNPKFPRKKSIIGVNFMSDTFHENVTIKTLTKIFDIMKSHPEHQFLLLTKRPDNLFKVINYFENETYISLSYYSWKYKNIWFGVSVENQATADERIPLLLKLKDINPNIKLWVSVEPMLGEVDLSKWINKIDWVVVGAESGKHRRYCPPIYMHTLVQQCVGSNIPIFIKQYHKKDLTLIKDIQYFPDYLQYQQFPGGMK